ncbi:MAG: hypothetical protein M3Y87_18455 [Myxococcota bacterium]|nr:hypothetical protein [Myxococcota bacterium]
MHRIVFEELDAGLLSVWGTSSRDVWTVGGDVDAMGPMVLHYDGAAWRRLLTGQTGDLWWVHGVEGGPVFLGGEGGMMLRYDGPSDGSGTFTRMETPSDMPIVFGIWGSSASDVLAVGGLGRAAGFVWRFDGTSWSELPLPSDFGGQSLFKVWGTGPNDAWIVGTDGAVLRWDGTALSTVDAGTTRTLFTVHAIDGAVAAVGGAGSGVLVQRDADGVWHDLAPELVPQLFGVFLTEEGGAAVGINGTFVRREGATWTIEDTGLDLAETLHSVWIDPDGGVWAAGGQVLVEPLVRGVLVYRGREDVGGGSFTM